MSKGTINIMVENEKVVVDIKGLAPVTQVTTLMILIEEIMKKHKFSEGMEERFEGLRLWTNKINN